MVDAPSRQAAGRCASGWPTVLGPHRGPESDARRGRNNKTARTKSAHTHGPPAPARIVSLWRRGDEIMVRDAQHTSRTPHSRGLRIVVAAGPSGGDDRRGRRGAAGGPVDDHADPHGRQGGRVGGLAAAKPGVQARERDYELAQAKAEIARPGRPGLRTTPGGSWNAVQSLGPARSGLNRPGFTAIVALSVGIECRHRAEWPTTPDYRPCGCHDARCTFPLTSGEARSQCARREGSFGVQVSVFWPDCGRPGRVWAGGVRADGNGGRYVLAVRSESRVHGLAVSRYHGPARVELRRGRGGGGGLGRLSPHPGP